MCQLLTWNVQTSKENLSIKCIPVVYNNNSYNVCLFDILALKH